MRTFAAYRAGRERSEEPTVHRTVGCATETSPGVAVGAPFAGNNFTLTDCESAPNDVGGPVRMPLPPRRSDRASFVVHPKGGAALRDNPRHLRRQAARFVGSFVEE